MDKQESLSEPALSAGRPAAKPRGRLPKKAEDGLGFSPAVRRFPTEIGSSGEFVGHGAIPEVGWAFPVFGRKDPNSGQQIDSVTARARNCRYVGEARRRSGAGTPDMGEKARTKPTKPLDLRILLSIL